MENITAVIVFVSLMVWTLGFFLDVFTTVYVLYYDGSVIKEANPIAEWIINHFGLLGFSIVNIIVWWAGIYCVFFIQNIYFLSILLVIGVIRLTAGISNYRLS